MRSRLLLGGVVAGSALLLGLGVGPAGAVDRLPGPWHRDAGVDSQPRTDDHGEGQDPSCGAPAAPTATTATTAAPAGALTQTVTVVVPPIVRVRTVDDGLVVVTNAERPPAPGDHVYLLGADGSYTPADDALVTRVVTATWADGSWCSTTAEHRSIG